MEYGKRIVIYFIYIFILISFVACGQNKVNPAYKTTTEVNVINNNVADTLFKINGGKLADSNTFFNIERNLNIAINMDKNYKLSYLNLIKCIEISNTPPYPQQAEYLKKLIAICNTWLISHPDDKDMIVKRGIYYEKDKNTSMADKDYAAIISYLNGIKFKLFLDIKPKVIEDYVSYAFLFVVAKRPAKGIKLIDNLYELFPDNPKVAIGHKILHTSSREEIVYQFKN
ncbi:MAG: hypothetical protein EOO93_17315 [Pedobacter sp.]|nr:MAG: hypothetical protein EOO93_17315 [Pedobacter sp.]